MHTTTLFVKNIAANAFRQRRLVNRSTNLVFRSPKHGANIIRWAVSTLCFPVGSCSFGKQWRNMIDLMFSAFKRSWKFRLKIFQIQTQKGGIVLLYQIAFLLYDCKSIYSKISSFPNFCSKTATL